MTSSTWQTIVFNGKAIKHCTKFCATEISKGSYSSQIGSAILAAAEDKAVP